MNERQRKALKSCCERFGVEFHENNYRPGLGTPDDWREGWIGNHIYVGCSPEGEIHS